jgi:hypothetical protein
MTIRKTLAERADLEDVTAERAVAVARHVEAEGYFIGADIFWRLAHRQYPFDSEIVLGVCASSPAASRCPAGSRSCTSMLLQVLRRARNQHEAD